MFASIHVGSIYPWTGEEDGTVRPNNVINVSLPPGASSKMFHDAFSSRILTALDKYQPDLLMLSSGFDAHKRDPTGNFFLEEVNWIFRGWYEVGRKGLLCHYRKTQVYC